MEWKHTTSDLTYEIALSRLEGIGNVLYKKLIAHFGSARDVFFAPKGKLLRITGIGEMLAHGFSARSHALREADRILKDSSRHSIAVVPFHSPRYPASLREAYDCPPILYMKGNGEIQQDRVLAVVGTRKPTPYGREVVVQVAAQLKGVQIVSGLAYGIDHTAHREALKNGLSTVAVLANGLDSVYPSAHSKMANEITINGLLISEQPVGSTLHPTFFLARNRIIAGISQAILVVESAATGGSMITAECGNAYDREVFAVPGNLFASQSEGTHRLISDHKARIFTSTESLVEWMQWNTSAPEQTEELELSAFSQEERNVIQLLLRKGKMHIDELQWFAEIPTGRLPSVLLNLEFRNIIQQLPGKKFCLKKESGLRA